MSINLTNQIIWITLIKVVLLFSLRTEVCLIYGKGKKHEDNMAWGSLTFDEGNSP